MQIFIMLTRLISEEVNPTFAIQKKEKQVVEEIREYCPDVKWVHDYAILGPWDYVDIFRAPDIETAMKVSAVVRSYGGAHTEIWPAVEWDAYEKSIHDLAEEMKK